MRNLPHHGVANNETSADEVGVVQAENVVDDPLTCAGWVGRAWNSPSSIVNVDEAFEFRRAPLWISKTMTYISVLLSDITGVAIDPDP